MPVTKPDDPDSAGTPPPVIARPDRASPTDAVSGNAPIQQPASVGSGASASPTIQQPNAPDPAAGVSGLLSRGIGTMVNGVPTFTDANVPHSFMDRTAAPTTALDSRAAVPNAPTPTVKPVMSDDEIAAYKAYAGSPVTAGAIARPHQVEAGELGSAITRPQQPTLTGSDDRSTWSQEAQAAFNSNAPGTAVFNGRIISPDEIQRLANTNVIPSESFRNPGLGVALSEATGGRETPTAQQGVAIQRPRLDQNSAGEYDPTEAARAYQSDLASIANKDPRSVLGIAARNAQVDALSAISPFGHSRRAMAAAQEQEASARAAALAPYYDAARGMFEARNTAGNANARDQTQFADSANTNATNVTRTGYETNARLAAAEARADAMSYGANQRAGATMYAADARANTPKVDSASTAAAGRIYQQALQDGKSPDQAHAAVTGWFQARQQANGSSNQAGRSGSDRRQQPSSPPPSPAREEEQPSTDWSSPAMRATLDAVNQGTLRSRQQLDQMQAQSRQQLFQPTPAAIQFLQQNPHFYDQFDAKYGQGAAAQYLRSE